MSRKEENHQPGEERPFIVKQLTIKETGISLKDPIPVTIKGKEYVGIVIQAKTDLQKGITEVLVRIEED